MRTLGVEPDNVLCNVRTRSTDAVVNLSRPNLPIKTPPPAPPSVSYAGGKKLMDIPKVNYVTLGGDKTGEHLLMLVCFKRCKANLPLLCRYNLGSI